jgi:hypothetical protein
MIRHYTILIAILLFVGKPGFSQSEISLEQYHYYGAEQPYTYMPVMHFQNKRNWYAEARYNYEDMQTFSLFLGKSFSRDNDLSYTFTPLLGGSVGRFKGISTGMNLDLEYDKFFFSTQSQYSFSTNRLNAADFLYNWSEIGFQGLNWLYAGLSFQQTYDKFSGNVLEHGVLIGFSFKKFTVPVYTFSPLKKERYFIIGLNFAWAQKPARNNFPVVKDDR